MVSFYLVDGEVLSSVVYFICQGGGGRGGRGGDEGVLCRIDVFALVCGVVGIIFHVITL